MNGRAADAALFFWIIFETRMKYKSQANFFIYFHLFLVVALICIICFYIKENPVGLSILIGLLLLTFLFNKADYIEINSSQIIVRQVYGLGLYRKSYEYNIADVINVSNVEGDGREIMSELTPRNNIAVILRFLTGAYFYQPINRFGIEFKDKSWKAFDVNTPTSDMNKIIKQFRDNRHLK